MGLTFSFDRTPGDYEVANASSGAATCDSRAGAITSETLSTAAGADYVLTLTNKFITPTSVVVPTVGNGDNTTEGLAVNRVQPGNGSVVIHIRNTHASAALNGKIVVSFAVM